MNAGRFQRVKEVYLRVAGLEAGQREQAIASECRGDDALATEVRSLLAAAGEPGFLAAPALGDKFSVAEAIARADGLAVGPYRTCAVLGAGTFGIVYRASRADGPDVALKVLRPGRSTPAMIERFLREAATLRQLSHPGIARVLATGTTNMFGDEVPWLAMDLIPGQPLDRHVRHVGADVPQRLELVAALADAVQHAHDLGVVHNDLKPENVLVTDAGEVKVIDFGLAAFVGDGEPTGGTLGYSSPERWGRREGGGVKADVWALGAIAYELLTDRLPLDWRRARASASEDVVEAWPLGALRPELRGDLATVVHHALATDPRRRCPSAAFFAAELRRYLAGQPIRSPKPGPLQRLAALARQHRTAAIGVSTTFVALVLGIVGTATGWANARNAWESEQAQRAKTEASLAEVIAARERAVKANSMLTTMLESPLDERRRGRSDLEAVFIAAAKKLTVEAADAAGLQPAIFTVLADSLRRVGHFSLACRQLEKAVAAAERAGSGKLAIAEMRLELAGMQLSSDETIAAERNVRQARAELDALPDVPPPLLFRCIQVQAQAAGELRNLQAMRRFIDEAAAMVADRPDTDADRLRVVRLTADAHTIAGDMPAAIRVLEEGLALVQESVGPTHTLTLGMTNDLASRLARSSQLERAEELYQRVLAVNLREVAADHPDVLLLQHNIGTLRVRQQRYDEAIAVLDATAAALVRRLGPTHSQTISTRNSLAWAHGMRGDVFTGEVILRHCLRDIQRSPEPEDFLGKSWLISDSLAEMLHQHGLDAEARPYAELKCLYEASRHGTNHAAYRRAMSQLRQLRPM